MEYMEILGGVLCCECNNDEIFQFTIDLKIHHDVNHSTVRPQQFRCSLCETNSEDESLMQRHLTTHFPQGRFQCVMCFSAFPSKLDITLHLRDVHEVKLLYCCIICGEPFPSEVNVIKHAKSRHDKLPRKHGPAMNLVYPLQSTSTEYMEIQGGYLCCRCTNGVTFHTRWHLRDHHQKRHGLHHPGQFRCSVCNFETASELFITEHVDDHFMDRRYLCLVCTTAFCTQSKCKQHLKEKHGIQMLYFCRECGDAYPSELNVIQHAFSKHGNYLFSSSDSAVNLVRRLRPTPMEFMEIRGGFLCFICDVDSVTFQTTSDLKAHFKGHHNTPHPLLFVCSVCHWKSDSESLMTEHVEDHFQRRRYMCLECSAAFHHVHEIKQHLKGVHRVRMLYTCHKCKKRLPSELNVIQHALSEHSNFLSSCDPDVKLVQQVRSGPMEFMEIQGGFLCIICGADGVIFQTVSDLKAHCEGQHDTRRPEFACSVCNYKCKDESLMEPHVEKHFMGRRYLCLECSTAFQNEYNVTRHLEEVHNVQMLYSCTICEKSFPSKLNVIKHASSEHNTLLSSDHSSVKLENVVRQNVAQATNVTGHAKSSHSNFSETPGPSVNPEQQDVGRTTVLNVTWDANFVNVGQQDAGQTTSDMESTEDSEDEHTAEDEEDHLVDGMMCCDDDW